MTLDPVLRRRAHLVAIYVAVFMAAAGLAYAALAQADASVESRVREVTTTIRCPVCIGESIADSTAPVSRAMREEAERRLDSGESPSQVREFFADAYGQDVLLTPPTTGAGAFVWIVPLLIGGAALLASAVTVVILARRDRHRPRRYLLTAAAAVAACTGVLAAVGAVALEDVTGRRGAYSEGVPSSAQNALASLGAAIEARPADLELRLAYASALSSQGRQDETVEQFAIAHRLRPLDADVAYLYGAALVSAGSIARAGDTLDALLQSHPDHAAGLVLRGTMLHQEGDKRGTDLLEQFVRLHPDDPSAEAVQDLLAGR